MTISDLKNLVREIVAESQRLCAAHTSEKNAPVNYACVFAHNAIAYFSHPTLATILKIAN